MARAEAQVTMPATGAPANPHRREAPAPIFLRMTRRVFVSLAFAMSISPHLHSFADDSAIAKRKEGAVAALVAMMKYQLGTNRTDYIVCVTVRLDPEKDYLLGEKDPDLPPESLEEIRRLSDRQVLVAPASGCDYWGGGYRYLPTGAPAWGMIYVDLDVYIGASYRRTGRPLDLPARETWNENRSVPHLALVRPATGPELILDGRYILDGNMHVCCAPFTHGADYNVDLTEDQDGVKVRFWEQPLPAGMIVN